MTKNYSNLSRKERQEKWRFYRNRQAKKNRKSGLCSCGQMPKLGLKSCSDCQERSKKADQRLKEEVIAAYGGCCSCPGCKVTVIAFLTIDHIRGHGLEHRQSLPAGSRRLYVWLKKNEFPQDDFRCLCMNCNWAGRFDGCPLAGAAHES